ncbi:MAG: PAS domain S-box protein, partial [Gemmatimonadetes bacterium]|nr:PAS domain S-box protein [Gemmatimonadota bacterium]
MPGSPLPFARRAWRALAAAPATVAVLLSAVLFLALLQYRHVDERERLRRVANLVGSAEQARLHVTRAYLIARGAGSGDANFSRLDADAALDRAELAVADGLAGRVAPLGSGRVPMRDAELRRLLTRYGEEVRSFRVLLARGDGRAAAVDVRRAFAEMEARGDSIDFRVATVLAESARNGERRHAATVFFLVLIVGLAATSLHRTEASRRRAETHREQMQVLAAALAAVRTPEEVARAIVEHGVRAVGAPMGSVGLLVDGGRSFEILSSAGHDADELAGWRRFPNAGDVPAHHAVAAGAPVFVESRDEILARFPPLREVSETRGFCAMAVIPLLTGSGDSARALGYVGFGFRHDRRFDAEERRFLETLTRLSAQAMDRALSHVAEREAEHALHHSEARFRNLAERLPLGVYQTSPDGRVTYCNPRMSEIFACTEEEVFDGLHFERVHPDDRERVDAQRRELRAGRVESQHFEFRVIHPTTHAVRHLMGDATLLRRSDGGVDGTVGVVEDVTGQRVLELQLREAQKMEAVGRLAGGVAHDFNNLLTVIGTCTEFLLEDMAGDDPRRADVVEIGNAASRAAALTHQLLAFSRRQLIQPRRFDLNELASRADALLRRLVGEDVEMALELPPGLPQAFGDPGQVEQALVNLVVNARDAMPEGGTISVRTGTAELDEAYAEEHPEVRPGSYLVLAVSDTGTGMDEDTLSHLFEPFFTTKEVGRGTGLGLAMVYGAMRQMGG